MLRILSLALLVGILTPAATAPASAADFGPRVEHRKHARVPLALRTLSYHSAAVLASGPCWRGCTAQCGASFQGCLRATPQDLCFAHNNACELVCLRQCRLTGGPFVNGTLW